ncbi:bactericidal permeability-increasing protein [Hydra vulgaris]|uniref:bactericidal permeability-increasing protein n=1 Tax=Hydra vulgaris TaxID=6087 RepID=UPI0002B4DA4A|nr:bactericidal permeability-increasing protein [Hydra vulgaris]
MSIFWICVVGFSVASCFPIDILNNSTQNGLDYVRKLGVPFIEKELLSLSIPDVKGTAKTPVGSISYEITSIAIKNVLIPKSNLTVSAESGLTVQCENAELDVNSNWKYKEDNWPHIKDSGTVTLTMKNINLDVSLDLDSQNETHPKIEVRKCSLKINDVNLKFNGGASWLYNLFADIIANEVKSSISDEICRIISKMVDDEGNKILNNIPEIVSAIKTQISMIESHKSRS